jgi:minor extracellular serine protease Vpr
MRHFYILIITLLSTVSGFSQTSSRSIQNSKKIGEAAKEIRKSEVKGVSPSTAIFMLKLSDENFSRQISESDSLRDFYGIKQLNGSSYVNAFVIASSEANLQQYGFIEGNSQGKIKTGLIPIEVLPAISSDEYVSYIQINEKVESTLDAALAATWVDEVHQGAGNLSQAYFGDGVIVGIIDRGFDYTHPSFYDSTYTSYRVERVWEQNSTSGTPPSGYSYGRELTSQASILNAQRDFINKSHGTHVAGTAAGSGAGTGGIYKGVAFKSDIVLVSGDFTDVGITDGIDYIVDYANSVNKPCVINLSLGKHVGPHDGSSAFDLFCDAAVGNGKLLVGAAGNEGNDPLYIGKSYTSIDTIMYSFVDFQNSSLGTNGITSIDIWGNQNQNFYVSVNIYNTNTNSFEDWTPYVAANTTVTNLYILQDDDTTAPDTCYVGISTSINPLNSKPNIRVYIDHTDQDDNYRWAMIEIIAYNTQTKMWANSAHFTDNGYSSPVVDGSTSSTVGEIGGTGNSIVSVGAYTSKNSYTNISNSTVNIPFQASLGEIAPFSSHGPTADNRTKPDITAPGNVIIAPVNRFDNTYTSSSQKTVYGVTDGTNTWYYGAMQGTSMAAPMVTGILALWLEAYPELNPTQALNLLKDNAYTDGFTGTIPSNGDNTWGWGKVDAEYGLLDLESKIPAKPTISPNGNISLCIGESQTLNAPSGFSTYEWSTSDSTQSISVSSAGNYSVRVMNNQGYYSPWSDTINLTINSPTSGSETVAACSSYLWNGTTYTATGTYTATLTGANGCDSVATLNLTINSPTSGSETVAACSSYLWNGTTYTATGTYTATLTGANGCDSVATLNLTINSPTSGSETVAACSSYLWNGTTYTATGTYTATLTGANGCDSVATLNLTINSPTSGSETVAACSSYLWNGTTYTTTGTYTATLTGANGCDSVATLNLTINSPTSGSETVAACSSYLWNGTTYTATGTYTATLTGANGCDSVATLNLTINSPTSGSETVAACSSYLWNGTTYTATGTYTATLTGANGCDSVATLNLTINSPTSGSETVAACSSYLWNGTTYTTTGTYTATLTGANGCDSVATLNLTINSPTSGTDEITACDSFTWIDGNTYTASNNTATYTLTNAAGCDSVVTLNLTIDSIDTTVTLSGLTIYALPGYYSYQWYECTANGFVSMNNETNDSIKITANGDYAVVINNSNCTDTSVCVTVNNIGFEEYNQVLFKLFPNPTEGMVQVERGNSASPISTYQMEIVDSQGKMIQKSNVNFQDGFIVINLEDYPAGIYQLTLINQYEVFHDQVSLVK